MHRVVVVGAGPAGIAAASAVAGPGVEVTLFDEAQRPGGQIYRSHPPGLRLDMHRLLGTHHAHYRDFHAEAERICKTVDYRPGTLVWSVHGGAVHFISGGEHGRAAYDALILATGATDRIMPVPGWTLPGVFSLGGAQALLKDQGCLVGRRTVFCGSSPLLYLAALQYTRMGGTVVAVVDTTPFSAKIGALPDMLAAPRTLAEGLGYIAQLRRKGVRVLHGRRIEKFEGADRVTALLCRGPGRALQRIACDSIAYGHGLRPESQLAELAGCAMEYDPVTRLHLPRADAEGRGVAGVYLAGDGARIGGAQAAALSGSLAGNAVRRDLGLPLEKTDTDATRRALRRLYRFQRGLAAAFSWPYRMAAGLEDSVILCRCENVSVGEVRRALERPVGTGEANRVKAATRCGMGRCQGRFCGQALAEVTAAALGQAGGPLDRLRAQSPVKPLPIAMAQQSP